MDDLNPELRLIAETARAASLTRADKARLWNRLQERVKAPARPRSSTPLFRQHWLPLSAVAALFVGLGLTGQAGDLGILRAPPAVDGVEAPERRVVIVPQQLLRNQSAVPSFNEERVAPALNARLTPAKPRTRSASNLSATAAAEPPTLVEGPDAYLEEPLVPRVRPARTRTLSSPALSVPAGVAVVERERPRRAPRSPSFHEKLAAENLARYQAAIAQQAQLAAIRRSPSSIGGYGAW
jgi:hypothetical protein